MTIALPNPDDAFDAPPVMNTTPLIDVLLVLLILFIITIPIQTHSVRLDLPSGPPPPTTRILDRNRLVLTESGALLWNGAAIDRATLRGNFDRVAASPRMPAIEFQPAPAARYELVDEVLVLARRANIGGMGFVGNETYRNDF